MRLYIPTSAQGLQELACQAELSAPIGFAVNKVVRQRFPEADEEELEFIAFTSASDFALRNLNSSQILRVVVSAEVPESSLQLSVANRYQILRPIARTDIRALHVDEPASVATLTRAQASGDAALLDDIDMLWYEPTELSSLIELLEHA